MKDKILKKQGFLCLAATLALTSYADQVETNKSNENDTTPFPQYLHEDIKIPAASADEPLLTTFSLKKAGDYLENGAIAWTRKRKCVSCHTTGAYMQVRPLLSEVIGKPSTEIRNLFVEQLERFQSMDANESREGANPAQVVYIAAGLAEWDRQITGKLSPPTKQALNLMLSLQEDNGTWGSETTWPPLESSEFQEATVAAMAVTTAPGWLENLKDEDLRQGVTRLHGYLRETIPPHNYGRVVLLWAATRMPNLIPKSRKQKIVRMIKKHQRKDGGWSIRSFATPEEWGEGNRAEKLREELDFNNPPSDGHMTGLALLVLRAAGVPKEQKFIQRGVEWLKANQRESGRWWTRSLNTDKSHYITYTGTAYPLLALMKCDALDP